MFTKNNINRIIQILYLSKIYPITAQALSSSKIQDGHHLNPGWMSILCTRYQFGPVSHIPPSPPTNNYN